MRCLAPHLRLEVQYALQCRHDEQKARIFPAQLQPILRGLAAQQVSSMLDKPEHHWRQCPNPPRTGNGWRAFTLGTYDRIETLAFGQGWDIEYPRDTWRLRKLGTGRPAATISFEQITQPWLKSLAKRWARWQLTTGRSSGTAARAAAALSRFSQFLAAQPASIGGLAQVDRPLLEAYLADLHTAVGGRKCHAQHLTALGGFLTAIRQHRWDGSALPASAMLFTEDYPRRAHGLPRALAAQVMAQLDRRDNLDRWDRPDYRLITMILMRCGLRISDACKIPSACLVTDADGAPYLRYFNRKMKREALVPIDGELHQLILQQQRRLQRWPSQVPVLFPRPTTNLDGHKPVDGSTYRQPAAPGRSLLARPTRARRETAGHGLVHRAGDPPPGAETAPDTERIGGSPTAETVRRRLPSHRLQGGPPSPGLRRLNRLAGARTMTGLWRGCGHAGW